ncbi:BTB/POZ domain-containing protein 3 [Pseudolycoriella hygida]|uniref:BTB/POZ domain-containing protein 3 n=1 Tax=Pseudolycoriella hygida TaxID=35572 RepID=A0A9Q0S4A1_9DIPT|nr:BTB/POZ domain-containing protein 3 [Pseudolycoriella hygida]
MAFNNSTQKLKNIQSLYLNEDGADVFFLLDGERIPGHKIILTAMSDYYKTMFYGSLREDNNIDMNDSNVSVESFKEFLKFIYMSEPNLTMDNIDGVLTMAKRSLSEDILNECEQFLKNSVTIDTMFFGYQLALLYDLKQLKNICKEEICVHAESVLKSASFLKFPFEHFQILIEFDTLACEEIDMFNACINWAKAACRQNNLDVLNAVNLRDQLRDLVHQIRFTSMTKEEAASCIGDYPGLFLANGELQEIICMIGHNNAYQPKQFNWTPRYFNLKYNKNQQIECSRMSNTHVTDSPYQVKHIETTRFTCNRHVILRGISCDIQIQISTPITVQINEIKTVESTNERYNQRLIGQFILNPKSEVYEASITLDKVILIRPNYIYDINITFETHFQNPNNPDMYSNSILKRKMRVDHDIVFNFRRRGLVSRLSLSRFDNKNYFQKIKHNPKTWMMLAVCLGAGYWYWKRC